MKKLIITTIILFSSINASKAQPFPNLYLSYYYLKWTGELAPYLNDEYLDNIKPKSKLCYTNKDGLLSNKLLLMKYEGKYFKKVTYDTNYIALKLDLKNGDTTTGGKRISIEIICYDSFDYAFKKTLVGFKNRALSVSRDANVTRGFHNEIIGDYCWHESSAFGARLDIIKSNMHIVIGCANSDYSDNPIYYTLPYKPNYRCMAITTSIAKKLIQIIDEINPNELP